MTRSIEAQPRYTPRQAYPPASPSLRAFRLMLLATSALSMPILASTRSFYHDPV